MAIDPPYRLDVFQNIINVHWEPPSPGSQVFVFTRDAERNGNWYPVSDEFYNTVLNAEETMSYYPLSVVATRLKHSVLITAGMTLAFPYTDDPNVPPQGGGFHTAWLTQDANDGGWPAVQPNRANPTYNGHQQVYQFVKGSYLYDDMATGDWPPEFQPLPP